MFDLSWFYEWHMYLIVLGVISNLVGVYIVKFKKGKKWRIKAHQRVTVVGSMLIIIGVGIMFLGKRSMGYDHLTSPHGLAGIFTLLLLVFSMVSSNLGLRGYPKFIKIHRKLGPLVTGLMVLVSIVGTFVFISYLA